MNRTRFLLCLLLLTLVALAVACTPEPAVEEMPSHVWEETARDVRIDGVLSLHIRVFRTLGADWVILYHDEWTTLPAWKKSETDTALLSLPEEEFSWDEGFFGAQTQEGLRGLLLGTVHQEEEKVFTFEYQGQSVEIRPHSGAEGTLTLEELFATAPSWRARMDLAVVDEAAVETLANLQREVTLELALSTWCGDSREQVPRLLAALSMAGNDLITLEMTGLARGFQQGDAFAAERDIERVPTVIVIEQGQELGRFVERPLGESIEVDLVQILSEQTGPTDQR